VRESLPEEGAEGGRPERDEAVANGVGKQGWLNNAVYELRWKQRGHKYPRGSWAVGWGLGLRRYLFLSFFFSFFFGIYSSHVNLNLSISIYLY